MTNPSLPTAQTKWAEEQLRELHRNIFDRWRALQTSESDDEDEAEAEPVNITATVPAKDHSSPPLSPQKEENWLLTAELDLSSDSEG